MLTFDLAECAIRSGQPDHGADLAHQALWVPLSEARKLAAAGEITDGPSLAALTYYLGIYRPGT